VTIKESEGGLHSDAGEMQERDCMEGYAAHLEVGYVTPGVG
jgi:hypothetical protein